MKNNTHLLPKFLVFLVVVFLIIWALSIKGCPELQNEIISVYEYHQMYSYRDETGTIITIVDSNVSPNSTTSLEGVNVYREKVRDEPNLEAIEHNRRVMECQTFNGEF
jgi:hypothetical protein